VRSVPRAENGLRRAFLFTEIAPSPDETKTALRFGTGSMRTPSRLHFCRLHGDRPPSRKLLADNRPEPPCDHSRLVWRTRPSLAQLDCCLGDTTGLEEPLGRSFTVGSTMLLAAQERRPESRFIHEPDEQPLLTPSRSAAEFAISS
jgi:hypothetical protein